MKNMRKLLTMVLAVMMVMSLATTAFAAGTGTITITPPSGVDSNATNTYKIYKVFDADGNGTNISYKLVDGKETAPEGFSVDSAGNVTYTGQGTDGQLTEADIDAIASYVTEADLVDTVTAVGSTNAVSKELPNGYYYITTSVGTVVTIDSTNPNVAVNDKNTVPTLDKIITGASSVDEDGKKALAQIGTDVTYTGYVTVGTGAENYVYHDTMENGLKFKGSVTVSIVGGGTVDSSKYVLKTEGITEGETFNVVFDNEYIAKLAVDTKIAIEYQATITTNALTADPENNTAYLSYGHTPGVNKTPTVTTDVYNAKFTVTKQDGDGQSLAGAGFVIAKSVADTSEGAGEGDTKTVYYKLENNIVSWVDSIDDATEYTSNDEGKVTPFTGLANGTYTLVEKTVPAGYNKAADSTFTVAAHDYTTDNLEQSATVTNNAGTELPSTGGMGTTMFYIIGGLLMLVAVVLLVTKKRMASAE